MGLQKKKKATTKEKLSMLLEPTGTWNYIEIMKYFNFSYGKANNIMRDVEEKKGKIPYYEGKAKRRVRIEDVLEMFGTTRIKEMSILMTKQDLKEGVIDGIEI